MVGFGDPQQQHANALPALTGMNSTAGITLFWSVSAQPEPYRYEEWPARCDFCVPQIIGRNKPCCCEFFVNCRGMSYARFVRIPSCHLHRFRGRICLRWLVAPDSTGQQSTASAKLPNKGKKLPEKPDSNVTTMTEAESGAKDRDKTEITASTAPSGTSNNVAPEASRNEPGVSEVSPKAPTQKDDDVPGGGCTPIGVTASGKLVFPMQCQAFLEPHRGSEDFQLPVSTNPPETVAPPKERQAVEPAPSADQTTGLNREGSVANEANAKVEDVSPSGKTEPSRDNSEPEVVKGRKTGKRNMHSSGSKPVMVILRTVEFPDGRREERLLPMNRSRRTSLRTEDQWFNPQ